MCTILLANEFSGLLATVACRKRRGFTESGVNSNQNQFFIHRLFATGLFFISLPDMQTYILITLVVIATIHLMMASVLFLYSRYKVQYLSLAWIMGIFGVLTCVSFPFMPLLKFANVGLLHPFMLFVVGGDFFSSGHLSLEHPHAGIFAVGTDVALCLAGHIPYYIICRQSAFGKPSGDCPYLLRTGRVLVGGPDMLFRLAGLGLSVYYVTNILRLPRLLVKNAEIPRYLKGYVTAMGLNMVFYIVVTAVFNAMLLLVYFYLFCLLNMYLFYRTLETMAIHLPKPEIVEVDEAPTEEVIVQAEKEDFKRNQPASFRAGGVLHAT